MRVLYRTITVREELARRRKTEIAMFVWLRHSGRVALDKRFCVTRQGFIGLVPEHAMSGDMICIFKRARVPFLLRQNAEVGIRGTSTQTYFLVGECYIHGMMDGEMMKGLEHFQELNIQ